MSDTMIPFNKPYMTGEETKYILEAHQHGQLAGNGPFTQRCQNYLEETTGAARVLLTHSCTAALEMSAILLNLEPGDEVIMPSYTFVSTANAFVLRGAVPVFVDIREDTLNIDETLIEAAITKKSKAIVVVHYAGVACEMDSIMNMAEKHQLYVIEDAAQGVMSSYKGRPLGSIGHMAAFSFHETKNIISGEGGALLINDVSFSERAEILWEKGTNRSSFFRGEVDKYTWVDIGSSFLPGELIAAFLWAQLNHANDITNRRLQVWEEYYQGFSEFEKLGIIRRPQIPQCCQHNAHMFYFLLNSLEERSALISSMKQQKIMLVFHYVPLHLSPAGHKYCRTSGVLPVTEKISEHLVRLPLWPNLGKNQKKVMDCIQGYLK
ncbi:MAG: dTDP-4-amino-4,6-dideoxygalactose transaminase [Mariprofundaceae bacterium]|nr:dTDP-4-amino-4,6-dideoxygalactose transaminase [Mariprofundaceae bacterium]